MNKIYNHRSCQQESTVKPTFVEKIATEDEFVIFRELNYTILHSQKNGCHVYIPEHKEKYKSDNKQLTIAAFEEEYEPFVKEEYLCKIKY